MERVGMPRIASPPCAIRAVVGGGDPDPLRPLPAEKTDQLADHRRLPGGGAGRADQLLPALHEAGPWRSRLVDRLDIASPCWPVGGFAEGPLLLERTNGWSRALDSSGSVADALGIAPSPEP